MKKILAVLMSMIVITGVCGVGTGCDPNKETEAEYKARIKKELDEIPVEATGYKLVDPTKQEVTYPKGEEPIDDSQTPRFLTVNSHEYLFAYKTREENPNGITLSIDGKEFGDINFKVNDFLGHYQGQYRLFWYEEKFFIVRYRDFNPSSFYVYYTCFRPPLLFYYDIDENAAKYMGYLSEWFEYKIADIRHGWLTDKMFAIVKV